jgi:6-phosphogluconolactonase
MSSISVHQYDDAASLAAAACAAIVRAAREAVHQRGRFTLALTGGSTPEKTYRLLAGPTGLAALDLTKLYFFLGDERFVPRDDPRSNFGMIRRTLLAGLPVAADHMFPIPSAVATPAAAAEQYAAELASFFGVAPSGPPPTLDLVLLGVGDDGHVASLFPGAAALEESEAWVTWSPPGALPPSVDRVTFTFPTINAAREVMFLVAGANKAAAVHEVLAGNAAPRERPAAGVHPVHGTIAWLLDAAAASANQ